jgi:hypothetical protein
MGRCQTETSYLKSVLLWLQEYWAGPAPRVYQLKRVEVDRDSSVGRTHGALNRQDVITDLPCVLGIPNRVAMRRLNLDLEQSRMDSVPECTE